MDMSLITDQQRRTSALFGQRMQSDDLRGETDDRD